MVVARSKKKQGLALGTSFNKISCKEDVQWKKESQKFCPCRSRSSNYAIFGHFMKNRVNRMHPRRGVWLTVELRRPNWKGHHAEPIPIEPMHSFSYCHLCQWEMACGGVRATKSHMIVPILVNLCNAYNFAIWYWRFTLWSIDAVKSRYPLTSTTWQFHRLGF